MLVGKPVSQIWTLGEEGILKLTGFAHVTPGGGALMHSDAAKETEVCPRTCPRTTPHACCEANQEDAQDQENRGCRSKIIVT